MRNNLYLWKKKSMYLCKLEDESDYYLCEYSYTRGIGDYSLDDKYGSKCKVILFTEDEARSILGDDFYMFKKEEY